jgi:integrase
VVALKVSDIDSKRMMLRMEQGKGRKDRFAMLSPQLLELLRDWTCPEKVDTFAKLLLEQEGVLWVRHVVNIRMNLSRRLWSFW